MSLLVRTNGSDSDPNDYRVTLESFEGPLDLLLHLIKKDDVNIYDIPIALVLEQYLEYLKKAKELNIDLAAEFLLMAAELILIKSHLLVPVDDVEREEEGPDPRSELVRRLLEYQRYKDASKELLERPMLGKDVFKRGTKEEGLEGEDTLDADMTALLLAFQGVLRRLPKDQSYEVHLERISVQDKIMELTERLKSTRKQKFHDLFDLEKGKPDAVVTFLALLEMSKMKMVRIRQGTSFDEIFIISRIENVSLESLDQGEE